MKMQRPQAESPSPRDCLGCLGLAAEKMQKAHRQGIVWAVWGL